MGDQREDESGSEEEFLARYKGQEYPKPSVTVDVVIFSILDGELKVLLIQRKAHPFRGCWAIPGGFVDVGNAYLDQGEDLDAAAHRELEEETSLPRGSCFLEQLYTFGKAGRDPRTRVITVAYYALVRPTLAPLVHPQSDAQEARWFGVWKLWEKGHLEGTPEVVKPLIESEGPGPLGNASLAFDHSDILTQAIRRIRGKIDYAPIAFDLVPERFTVSDLRSVFEVVKGTMYHAGNFQRRFQRMLEDGTIVPAAGETTRRAGGRPARLYRFVRPA
ncbi:MAG: NUDIX hydrolase [Myxococcales bacterium]|nr:NUDIX hydrolase [Myxococcales bacterium]